MLIFSDASLEIRFISCSRNSVSSVFLISICKVDGIDLILYIHYYPMYTRTPSIFPFRELKFWFFHYSVQFINTYKRISTVFIHNHIIIYFKLISVLMFIDYNILLLHSVKNIYNFSKSIMLLIVLSR